MSGARLVSGTVSGTVSDTDSGLRVVNACSRRFGPANVVRLDEAYNQTVATRTMNPVHDAPCSVSVRSA